MIIGLGASMNGMRLALQTIEITETLDPPMTWRDVVADMARLGWHVVLIIFMSTVMITGMLAALNPETDFPDIPWALSGLTGLLLVHRMALFLIDASDLNRGQERLADLNDSN